MDFDELKSETREGEEVISVQKNINLFRCPSEWLRIIFVSYRLRGKKFFFTKQVQSLTEPEAHLLRGIQM